ncbi:AMP-binding protein [Spirillospora sp. NPDC048823]|uniref:AMP-binding protein n=1 Tax=unclassified Spirillospora TaxID=2642701 RepID=UPI00371ABDB3
MYAAQHAINQPDKPAIIMAGSGEVVTFAQFEALANRIAHLFRSTGLARLDHVAFFMENTPWLLECEAGAERSGLYYTLINSHLTAPEAAYIVDDCEARVVITTAAMLDVAADLVAACPRVARWLVAGAQDPPAPFERLEDAIAGMDDTAISDERLGVALLYSSGTTGRPKGVLRPLPDVHPAEPVPVMEFAARLFRQRPGMVYLSPAPLYHSAPQVSIAGTLRIGGTSIVMERFDAREYLRLIAHHGVTHTQVVPTMFSRLLKLPADVRETADLSSLESVTHGAAACPVPVKEQMIGWWGPIFHEYYSATEGHGFTICDSHEWQDRKGTVGKAVLGELLIVDDDGNECPPNRPGLIYFRGATNFEYFKDPEKTAESRDPSGTASTVGDVGHVDGEGYLYLTDRKINMIVSGGVNIYPQETEDLLITHPKVLDAAVIGVPDDDLGEVVKAIVQPVGGIEPDEDLAMELIAFCREHLARYKCPRSIGFEAELPRQATGKLHKRLLRERH